MKNALQLLLIASLIALGWWSCNALFPSAEKILRKKMTALAATATFDEKSNVITRAAKVRKLGDMFGSEAQITLEFEGMGPQSYAGREEISEALGAAFTALPSLQVKFLDVSVRCDAGMTGAEVSCTAKVSSGDSKDYGVQSMRFFFRKQDDEWLIVRVECVKTLS